MIHVLKNIALLYQCKPEGRQADVHPLKRAAIVWEDERILWIGSESEIPDAFSPAEVHDAAGKILLPGLIDCHTHLAFGGWRAEEFEMRIRGESYLDIAKAGGGILSTVKDTREATEDELLEKSLGFLGEIASLGVTTIECKSGYGLDLENELKLLRVYESLTELQPIQIVSTFLGAHTVPKEFGSDRAGYLDLLTKKVIPQVAKERLAQFCDVFVEDSAFSVAEARGVFEVATRSGLKPKLHADQLSEGRGALLAAEVGAVSADHLECVSDEGIVALREKGVVAVTLPIASLYTHQTPLDAQRLIHAQVPVAVATDFNPGSAPSCHLPMAMMLGCTMNRMTPAESLKGATYYAAKAIGLEQELGSLEHGKQSDFCLIDAPSVEHWLYHFRPNACVATVKKGQVISGALP